MPSATKKEYLTPYKAVETPAWPVFGMTALKLRTIFTDPKTGEDIHPTENDLAHANALVTGDWDSLNEFTELTDEEKRLAFWETISWYDKNAPEYTDAIKNIVSMNQVKDFIDRIPANGRILDAGCGGGRDCGVFENMGFRPVGLDLSQGMITAARKDHPEIDFIRSNFIKIPFPDNTFDGLWSHASIHHLGDLDSVKMSLREFNRVLKKGSIIHIATQAQTGDKDTIIIKDELAEHNRFYRYFTLKQLESMIAEAGFKDIRITHHKETDDDVSTKRKNVEWLIALAIKD